MTIVCTVNEWSIAKEDGVYTILNHRGEEMARETEFELAYALLLKMKGE